MAVEETALIKENTRVGPRHFRLTFDAAAVARNGSPGQFLMVKISGSPVLLRRPLGIHAVRDTNVAVLYEVVGRATEALSLKKPGEEVGFIGPLGTGFAIPSRTGNAVLVAGGMGVAPLYFLAQRLTSKRPSRRVRVLIGARTKAGVLCAAEFKKTGCAVSTATDDGSSGLKGYVTQLLEKVLAGEAADTGAIFACGPRPMLRELCRISAAAGISAQISLEEHMACGFGACMGCAVMTTEGFRRVCSDGPVFDATSILWDKQPS